MPQAQGPRAQTYDARRTRVLGSTELKSEMQMLRITVACHGHHDPTCSSLDLCSCPRSHAISGPAQVSVFCVLTVPMP